MDEILKKQLEPLLKGTPSPLSDCIRYMVYGEGKRIRMRLLMSSADFFKLSHTSAQEAAVALELLHTYTLIHDDLPCMDNDDIRRGKPSAHRAFNEATALLAGDALQSMAYELWSKNHAHCIVQFAYLLGPSGLIGGQAMEESLRNSKNQNIERLLKVFEMKTANLFIIAATLPAWTSNASDQQTHTLHEWAKNLGIAFQVADDLEDHFLDKKSDPAHVAYYFKTPTEAAQQTLQKLNLMDDLLKNQFQGQDVSAFLGFSNEIKQKLEETV